MTGSQQPGRSRFHDVGGLRLHTVEAGEGPLVVLLHGFPEFWYSWRHQIPVLAGAGFHVVAPDLPGYNLSDKPRALDAYRVSALARAVADLVRACGHDRATVVGHDWGGGVAWGVAARHPEVLERLVTVNSPHPIRFLEALRGPRQAARSWYMGLFQLPWVPEALLRARGFAVLRAGLRWWAGGAGVFSEEDLDRYVEAWAQPGALTGGLNFYRAIRLRQRRETPGGFPAVAAPVLVVWGDRDPVLGVDLADPGERFASDRRVEHVPEASHFVHAEAPDLVNGILIDFICSAG